MNNEDRTLRQLGRLVLLQIEVSLCSVGTTLRGLATIPVSGSPLLVLLAKNLRDTTRTYTFMHTRNVVVVVGMIAEAVVSSIICSVVRSTMAAADPWLACQTKRLRSCLYNNIQHEYHT